MNKIDTRIMHKIYYFRFVSLKRDKSRDFYIICADFDEAYNGLVEAGYFSQNLGWSLDKIKRITVKAVYPDSIE